QRREGRTGRAGRDRCRTNRAQPTRSACLGLILVLLGSINVAYAQDAAIEGRVVDQQDRTLVGVTVALSAPSLPAPVVVVTTQTGAYRFASLEPGRYTVAFTLSGFQSEQRDVTLGAGERRTLGVELGLAPFSQQVDVVAVSPLLGAPINRDIVAASVSVLAADELGTRGAASLSSGLNERLGAVSLEDTTTNLFQPTLRFRGFTASPLLGLPQGIAVYQNGARINEPFGDTVQFDLVPQFALDRLQLSAGAEPTFGLNALGGALALRLKNGFDNQGFRGELSAGSFERFTGTAELGASRGPWAIYLGATRFDESGWRTASDSAVTQAVADLGYRDDRADVGLSVTFADTRLNGNGPLPVELLAADRSAVFTFPDTTENRLALTQGRFNLVASPTWSLQLTGYYRDLDRRTLNGDEAEFGVCDDDLLPAGAPVSTLCANMVDDDDDDDVGFTGNNAFDDANDDGSDDGNDDDASTEPVGDPLVDVVTGRFITADDVAGDGAFNRTTTASRGYGATGQVTATTPLGNHDNVLVLGAAADLADVDFSFNSEVGSLTDDRSVIGSGLFAGVFGQAPDDIFNTGITTENRAFGLYFSDTLSLTERAHLTVSGRYNDARIEIHDQLGTSLNGSHSFSRFNPAVGLVVQAYEALSVFGRYAESNRAPTAAELSCADPDEPCRIPNAFISDPPLEQAVARSVEGGARGRVSTAGGPIVSWSATVYRTGIADDILFVASPELRGTGFFQNGGDTRRIGLDVELSGNVDRVGWFASYGLVEATFESPLELPSNREINDAATDDGIIAVAPGDRLPGIPRHSLKAGVGIPLSRAWDVAVETVVTSSRVFVGDEGNDQAELAGYGLVNLRTSYQMSDQVELFLRVDNLLDTEYETFGALAEIEIELDEAPGASDPRFVGPGAPRSAFAGVRVGF
ncbi:MAG: TonB-dependent receptor, partial [Vicinamibacterales bacterium]|nr:TonB-dependent receptor [Vicinamibacterales bacterium]